MNEEDYSEKASGFLLGKEFIIVLVIVFSGVSFTLGYFVGMNTIDTASISPLQAAEGIVQQNRQDLPPAPPVQAPLPPAENAADGNPPQAISGQTVPAASVSEKPADKDAITVPHEQKKGMDAPSVSADTEKAVGKSGSDNRTDEKTRLYAVQIGAFKSTEEAKQLKTRFEKKGYKSFVSVVKDKNGNKIYKVKTGEFSDKKEAEVLALKLRKAEGLHTYVTTKSE